MGKWNDYTTKTALKDSDELMILDKDANANKRTLMDKIWDYVVDKMTNAVVAKLNTTNKTMIGAINELNSNAFPLNAPTNVLQGKDLNNVMTHGTYTIQSNCENVPTSLSDGILVVIVPKNSNYVRQIYFGGYLDEIFTRTRYWYNNSFTWHEWKLL